MANLNSEWVKENWDKSFENMIEMKTGIYEGRKVDVHGITKDGTGVFISYGGNLIKIHETVPTGQVTICESSETKKINNTNKEK